jgi:hypothetical protein
MKKGQGLPNFLMFIMIFFLVILSAPILFEAVDYGANNSGTLSGFIITLFPWVILILVIFWGIKSVTGGPAL